MKEKADNRPTKEADTEQNQATCRAKCSDDRKFVLDIGQGFTQTVGACAFCRPPEILNIFQLFLGSTQFSKLLYQLQSLWSEYFAQRDSQKHNTGQLFDKS